MAGNRPKLEMLKYVFNRPTVGQAFGETITEYARLCEEQCPGGGKEKVEREVVIALKEFIEEQKDLCST